MPAEWEPHRATWIAWPHHEPDWPGKLGAIPWVYAEIVRLLADHETVEILCHSEEVQASALRAIEAHAARTDRVRLHIVPTDRVWLRDSAPTAVIASTGKIKLLSWAFNAWAKYPNWQQDAAVGRWIAEYTGLPLEEPHRAGGARIVLEGGGLDVNGEGLLLVTEEWLLSSVQVRNPGLTRLEYEEVFRQWLGVHTTIWLGAGCVGDDTHGHVDDVARFVASDTVVVAVEEDPSDENHERSIDNLRRLQVVSRTSPTGDLRIVKLPFPRPVIMNGERLPASYANFYIANGVVLVPTFNDPNDRVALSVLAELMPARQVIGVHALDLVWGLGTLHCLTQQEPQGR
jgi:agmatine deiminase